jgi:hypothetical protein
MERLPLCGEGLDQIGRNSAFLAVRHQSAAAFSRNQAAGKNRK